MTPLQADQKLKRLVRDPSMWAATYTIHGQIKCGIFKEIPGGVALLASSRTWESCFRQFKKGLKSNG